MLKATGLVPFSQIEQSTVSTHTSLTQNTSQLQALNEDMFKRLAPTVAVLVAVMAVGAIGNILICYIFTRKLQKSSQNALLLGLGIFDLLSSCVGVPSEIFDIRHYYLYESVPLCKAMRFFTTFPSLASILVLLVIAVDRYRKICKPLQHQIRLCQTRIVLVVIVVIALTLSVPAIYIYGHRTFATPVPGLFGYDCSVDDAFKNRPYPLVYEGLFLAAFSVITVVLVSIYLRIWLETRRHIKYLKTHATFGSCIMDETTTTTSSYNYEDSSLENNVDDHIRTGSKRASLKSLRKMLRYRHSRGKNTSNSAKLSNFEGSKRPLVNPVTSDSTKLRHSENLKRPPVNAAVADSSNVRNSRVSVVGAADSYNEEIPQDTEDSVKYTISHNRKRSWQGDCEISINPNKDVYGDQRDKFRLEIMEKSPQVFRKSLTFINDGRNVASNDSSDCSIRTASGDSLDEKYVPIDVAGYTLSQNGGDIYFSSVVDKDNLVSLSSYSNKPKPRQDNGQIASLSATPRTDTTASCDHSTQPTLIEDPSTEYPQHTHSEKIFSPVTSDSVNQIELEENNGKATNCLEDISLPPTFSEKNLNDKNKELLTKFNDTSGSKYAVERSREESECLIHSDDQRTGRRYQENDSAFAGKAQISDALKSNKISFVGPLNDKWESDDSKVVFQPLGLPLRNPSRTSQHSRSKQPMSSKRVRKALQATRTTIIAFAITSGFIISYLPHLILMILRSVRTDFEHQMDDVSLIFYNIFLRSYFANNVINIFVYGTMNLEFRTHIVNLGKKIKCSKK